MSYGAGLGRCSCIAGGTRLSPRPGRAAVAPAASTEDQRHGIDPAADKQAERLADSYSELAQRYLSWAERELKAETYAGYSRILTRDILPRWGALKIKDISRKDVIKLIDVIIERDARVLANRTLAVIRQVFNFAIQKDVIAANPCQALRMPNGEHARERVLSPDEIRKLWGALAREDVTMAGIIRMGLLTAQRPGEIRGMRWADIDQAVDNWTIPVEMAKNGRAHSVPLSPQAIELLKELRALACESPWVFPSDRGTNAAIVNAQKFVQRLRARVGFHFTLHDLRRTAATNFAAMGVPRVTISLILNHTETSVTGRYDRHRYDDDKRRALDAWGDKLSEIVNGQPEKWASVLAM